MIRKVVIFLFALAALLGSLTATLATIHERNFMLRGYVDPTQTTALPFRLPLLGVNADLVQYPQAELERQLMLMDTAQITWVRQIVSWAETEPERGQYRWEQWDTLIATVSEYPTLQFVIVFYETPAWARTAQAADQRTAPPQNPADFAAFVRAFTQRYGWAVDYYQVWEEPNLTTAWGGLPPSPLDYLALLAAGYDAIHSADAEAVVIAAALAPTTEQGPQNISDLRYLHELYAAGAGRYFDAAAAKPFGFNTDPLERTVDDSTLNFSRIIALREIMVANDDGQKALWASGWGWNSLPTDWQGAPSIWGSTTPQQQVDYTLAGLQRAEREWAWLGGMVLHQWQPNLPEDDPQWGFALLDPAGNPTPLYSALAARQPVASAQDGLFAAENPYARYSGVWTFGALGADIGWLNDSRFEFSFHGRDIALLLREDNYVAYLYPTIDRQPANATPRDNSGTAYVILTSGSYRPETNLIPIGRNLSEGEHLLQVAADRGWDQWALVGYAVSSGNLAEPYDRQIVIGWFSTLITGVAFLYAGIQFQWQPQRWAVRLVTHGLNDTGRIVLGMVTSLALLAGMFLTWQNAVPDIFRRDTVQIGLSLLTAGLIYLQPGIVITLLALALLFVIFFHHTYIGLMLTLFWSPFFLAPIVLWRFAFPLAELLLLITAAAWVLRSLGEMGKRRRQGITAPSAGLWWSPILRWSALDWGIATWLVVGVMSLTWSANVSSAVTELRTLILEPVLFYTILRTLDTDRSQILRLIETLLTAAFAVAAIGFFLYLFGSSIGITTGVIEAEGGARRLASVYGSPNNVALFLGRCIPFALAFALVEVHRVRRWLSTGVLAVLLLTVLFTQSVGAIFLGVPLSCALVLLLLYGKRARRAMLALGAIVAAAFAFSMQFERFARVLDFTSGTNFFRLRVWESGINMLRDHPITGLGMDQFLYAFRGTYILPDAWEEPTLSHPHNFILDWWIRLGLFGLAVFVWMQAAFWRSAWRVYQAQRQDGGVPVLLAITVGAMGSMLNILGHGLIDNSVFVNDLSLVFVLLLALMHKLPNTRAIDANR